jgi:NTP pyrophosphatase (non-canonical NTP hydrolase)
MNPEIEKKLNEIANHYGFTSQANMLTEEAAEFTVALNKFRRGNTNAYDDIKEEVADVIVIAMQLRGLLGADKIDEIIHYKIGRQLDRIQNEKAYCEDRINAQMEVVNYGKQ